MKVLRGRMVMLTVSDGSKYASKIKREVKRLSRCRKKMVRTLEKQNCKILGAIRENHASRLDSAFVNSGVDVEVRAYGRCKRKLRLKWIWNRVSIKQAENNLHISEQARKIGFEYIKWDAFTNYYSDNLSDSTSTVDNNIGVEFRFRKNYFVETTMRVGK